MGYTLLEVCKRQSPQENQFYTKDKLSSILLLSSEGTFILSKKVIIARFPFLRHKSQAKVLNMFQLVNGFSGSYEVIKLGNCALNVCKQVMCIITIKWLDHSMCRISCKAAQAPDEL